MNENSTINVPSSIGIGLTIHSFSDKFDWKEYAVFTSVLFVSSAIGVFYGCFGTRQKSTEEYLLANRRMSSVPVALSLLSSFVSSITLLGTPVEIYYYGLQYSVVLISFIPLTISLSYFYVPVFFNLQLSSAYEYIELRFGSKARTIVSLVGILHCVIYMAVIVYGPSLAISQVTGIPTRISTAVIFLVCIFYSSLGGLKAVVWTDALQAIIMLSCMVAVVWRGVIDIHGWKNLWDTSFRTDRAQFFNFSLDPRVRHTFWTSLIGGYFMWLPLYAATQSQIQRYLSMPTLSRVRRALFMNMIGLFVIIGLCFLAGMILAGKYHNCDPVQLGTVENSDQLLPFLVMETLGNYSGLPGLFVAGIICASLSSVSSGLSALASILSYDYVRNWFPKISDENLSRVSKMLCVLIGLISYGFVFLAEMGNILPTASTLIGALVGPVLGMFTLGMFFPWANSKGSMMGLILSFLLMTCLIVGINIASYKDLLPDQRLNTTTEGCSELYNITTNSEPFTLSVMSQTSMKHEESGEDWRNLKYHWIVDILSISYIWFPTLGCLSCIIFGLIFSFFFIKCNEANPVNPELISPPVLWLLCYLFPSHMGSWLEPHDLPMMLSSSSYSLGLRKKMQYSKETNCDIQIKRISTISGISFSYRN